jgi:Ca2+-binding RTX toxin-like protein
VPVAAVRGRHVGPSVALLDRPRQPGLGGVARIKEHRDRVAQDERDGDLEFVRVGSDDLVIRINGTDDEVTIKGQFNPTFEISNFQFADGTVLTFADVQAIIAQSGPGHVTHRGTAAAETILGTSLEDIIDGRGGDDLLKGDWGSDTYIYRVGSGNDTIQDETGVSADVDTVKLVGLNSSDVTLGRTGSDLFVTINASGETVRVAAHFDSTFSGIERLSFADGTSWDRTRIQSEAWLRGTDGPDTIGGIRYKWSESPWAKSWGGLAQWGAWPKPDDGIQVRPQGDGAIAVLNGFRKRPQR